MRRQVDKRLRRRTLIIAHTIITTVTSQCTTVVTTRVATTLSLCHKMDTTRVTKLRTHTQMSMVTTDMATTRLLITK